MREPRVNAHALPVFLLRLYIETSHTEGSLVQYGSLSECLLDSESISKDRCLSSCDTRTGAHPSCSSRVERLPVLAVLHNRYRSIVGLIGYLVQMTRCDLAFAFSQLSQFLHRPDRALGRCRTLVCAALLVWYT